MTKGNGILHKTATLHPPSSISLLFFFPSDYNFLMNSWQPAKGRFKGNIKNTCMRWWNRFKRYWVWITFWWELTWRDLTTVVLFFIRGSTFTFIAQHTHKPTVCGKQYGVSWTWISKHSKFNKECCQHNKEGTKSYPFWEKLFLSGKSLLFQVTLFMEGVHLVLGGNKLLRWLF